MVRQTKQSREDVLERSPAGTAGRSDVERKREKSYETPKATYLRTERGEGSSYKTYETFPGAGPGEVRPVFWYAVDVGVDSDGSRKRVKGRSLKGPVDAYNRCMKNVERRSFEGNDKPVRQKRRRQRETAGELSDYTMSEYFDRWIADLDSKVLSGSLASNTVHHYRGSFKNHILPALGHLQMWQVERDDIREFFQVTLPAKRKMVKIEGEWVETEEPLLNASGIRNIHRPLKKMFNFAVEEDQLMYDSPVRESFVPKSSDIKPPEDLKTVLQKTKLAQFLMGKAKHHEDEFTQLWLWLNFTGLRVGERNGLCWSSITDLETPNKAIMRIERQFIYESGLHRFVLKDQVKTKQSQREFPIPESPRQALVAWKKVQDEYKKKPEWNPRPGMEDLVLTTPEGLPIKASTDGKNWRDFRKRWLDENNPAHKPHIEEWRGHLNRHITATVLHIQKVDIEMAMRILGHSDREMTRYYISMAANTMRPSMDTYDDFWTTPESQLNKRIEKAGMALKEADEELSADKKGDQVIAEVEKRVASEPVSYSTKQVNNDKNSADVTSVEAVETEPKARVELIRKKKQDKKFAGMNNMTLNGKSRND